MFEPKKLVIIILAFLVAPAAGQAAWGQRSSSKPKPATAVEKDAKNVPDAAEKSFDLGPLQVPMQQCLDALGAFLKLKPQSEGKAKKAVPQKDSGTELKSQHGLFHKALKTAMDAKVSPERQAVKDSFLVYASQGLKGMNLVLEGAKKNDQDSSDKGWVFCGLALEDLQALNAQAGGKAVAGTAGEGIGPSMGINASFGTSTGSSNFNLGAIKSWPLTTSIDYGVGVNLGTQNSSSGSGSSAVSGNSLSIGFNGFGRYNFLQLFPKQPWIVPFVGLQAGYNNTNSDNTSAGKTTSTSFSSVTYGFQGGALFFFSRQTALNFQVSDDFMPPVSISSPNTGGSPTNSTSSTTTSTINVSLGLRFSY